MVLLFYVMERQLNREIFIRRVQNVYGENRHDYSEFAHGNNYTKGIIIYIWRIVYSNHCM
jgi:hypothetical protein